MTEARTALAQSTPADPFEIVELCATGLALLDAELHVVWINPALGERLGSALPRWLGASLSAIDAEVAGSSASALVEAAQRACSEQRTVVMWQARFHAKDDEELIGDVAFTPLDARRVLLELHTSPTTADRKASDLSQSLRGFAHEVKNPLAGMRGAAQLLERRLESSELGELAQIIIGEVDRLAALADRLLRASGKPRLARLNVHELIERVAALIAAEPTAPELRRDYDPSLPAALGDGDRLQQVLLNLARNAIEAEARTLTFRTRLDYGVRLGERLRRQVLRIDVLDDGRGVPPELVDTLFQPLVSGRADGTGLGLALAQEIAREHGGDVRYARRADVSVFTLLLPLENAHG
ncbi:MAG: ATP-binding protein [Dokdonella sp.]